MFLPNLVKQRPLGLSVFLRVEKEESLVKLSSNGLNVFPYAISPSQAGGELITLNY